MDDFNWPFLVNNMENYEKQRELYDQIEATLVDKLRVKISEESGQKVEE